MQTNPDQSNLTNGPVGRPLPTDPDALLYPMEAAYLMALSDRTLEGLRVRGAGLHPPEPGDAVPPRERCRLDQRAASPRPRRAAMPETGDGGKRQVRLFLMMADGAPFDLRLTAPEVRTLETLSSYRNNKTGLACPGTKRLARELGVGERAIQKHLRR